MPRDAILLLGPTGAGKTPLGELLEARGLWGRRCLHFDFGAQLRARVARDRPEALVSQADLDFLRRVLETGALLEDEQFPIAERVLLSFLQRDPDGAARIALNGLPRHAGQAAALVPLATVRAVVVLECPAETVLARLESNVGGDREGRTDDAAAAVRAKLATFARRTAPLVDHYRARAVPILSLPVGVATTPDELYARLESLAPPELASCPRVIQGSTWHASPI